MKSQLASALFWVRAGCKAHRQQSIFFYSRSFSFGLILSSQFHGLSKLFYSFSFEQFDSLLICIAFCSNKMILLLANFILKSILSGWFCPFYLCLIDCLGIHFLSRYLIALFLLLFVFCPRFLVMLLLGMQLYFWIGLAARLIAWEKNLKFKSSLKVFLSPCLN